MSLRYAERQTEYWEREKLNYPKSLDKARERQNKYYVPVKKRLRKEHQKQNEEVKTNFRILEASKSITLTKRMSHYSTSKYFS